jgi:hypothetical protein
MSYTQHTCIATCTLDGVSTATDAINLLVDWLGNNPEEIPDDLSQDVTAEDTAEELACYINMDESGQVIISLDTDGHNGNYNSEVFDFITSHFASIQSSDYMTVNWSCYDRKNGVSSGTDYYDQNGNAFDMHNKSKDSEALDQIAAILSGTSWDVDMLMSISDIITGTGRVIEEV